MGGGSAKLRAGLGHRTLRIALDVKRDVNLNDIVLDGVDDQIADGVQAEFSHDVAAVRFHRLRAQVQQRSDFLGTLSLRQKLSDLTLPSGQAGPLRGSAPASSGPLF